MDQSISRLRELYTKYINDNATDEERRALLDLFSSEEMAPVMYSLIDASYDGETAGEKIDPARADALFAALLSAAKRQEQPVGAVAVRRAPVWRTAWFRLAAAAVLLLVAGYWLLVDHRHDRQPGIVQTPQDVAPGRDGAILTLADGKQVVLDSAGNGSLVTESDVAITKKGSRIEYNATNSRLPAPGARPVYNTLSTPRGRQFQLVLPDGTKVWLNAASSITYPTLFTGGERKVKIAGEVYFEVAKNKQMPFLVDVAGKETVEVLGTHFNINAYDDEASIKTTLLEGKVKVSATDSRLKTPDSRLLTPGQQAILTNTIMIKDKIDTEKIVAWKNGVFNCDNTPIDEFIRQLARWYDLRIVYKGKVPEKILRGKLGRNLQLSQVLRVLTLFDIKYTVQGNTLTIE